MRRNLCCLALTVSLALATTPAAAQPKKDPARATELFNLGRAAIERGDWSDARQKLSESLANDVKVGTLLNLSEAEEHTALLVAARQHMQQAANLARAEGDDRRAAYALAEVARLDKLVPKMAIRLTGTAPRGLVVTRDDVALGPPLDAPSPIEPGPHVVSANAPGRKPWTTRFEAKADGTVTVVTLPELDVAPEASKPVSSTSSPSPAADETTGSTQRTIAVVVAGVGIAGVAVGTIFGLKSKSLGDDADGHCQRGAARNLCDREGIDLDRDAVSAGNVSTIAFTVGGVALVGAAILWLASPRATRVQARSGTLGIGGVW